MLEIVEGEAIGRRVCAQAYVVLAGLCMRWALVSMASAHGILSGLDPWSVPCVGARREVRSRPFGELRTRDAVGSLSIGPS